MGSRKKKKREKKKRHQRSGAAFPGSPFPGDIEIIQTPAGTEKMSEVIADFIEPYAEDCETEAQYRRRDETPRARR